MQHNQTKPKELAGLSPLQAAEALRARRALKLDRLLIADRPYHRAIVTAANASGKLGALPAAKPADVRVVVIATRRQRFVATVRRLLAAFFGRLFRSTSSRYRGPAAVGSPPPQAGRRPQAGE